MYQFMCILGPGILTWLLRREIENGNIGSEKSENKSNAMEESYFIVIAKIISYAFINMAVILLVFKPLGRVQLAVLSNGMLDVHYGAAAVFASVCVSVFLGITSLIRPNTDEEKQIDDLLGK